MKFCECENGCAWEHGNSHDSHKKIQKTHISCVFCDGLGWTATVECEYVHVSVCVFIYGNMWFVWFKSVLSPSLFALMSAKLFCAFKSVLTSSVLNNSTCSFSCFILRVCVFVFLSHFLFMGRWTSLPHLDHCLSNFLSGFQNKCTFSLDLRESFNNTVSDTTSLQYLKTINN